LNESLAVRARLLVPAFLLAGVIAHPAIAQEKKDEKAPVRAQKIYINNDRVRVSESVFKPGEVNPMAKRGYRVTRVLKGSTTLVRTHADGKTEKLEVKEGDVYVSPADNASTKNVGQSEIVIYTVVLKPE
jgi:mannose-6-phosphate isomerase-like protein (cupin superfamily)